MENINNLQQAPEISKAEMTARMINNAYLLRTDKARKYFQNAHLGNIGSFINNITEAVEIVLARMDENDLAEDSRMILSGGSTKFPESESYLSTAVAEANSNLIKNYVAKLKQLLQNCVSNQIIIAQGISENSFSQFAYSENEFRSLLITKFFKLSDSIKSQIDVLFESLNTFEEQAKDKDLGLSEYRNNLQVALEKFNLIFGSIIEVIAAREAELRN